MTTDDIPMTTDNYRWLPMTTNDYQWLPMTSDDFRWLSDADDCLNPVLLSSLDDPVIDYEYKENIEYTITSSYK